MAMIKCPECGKEISDKAANCPNCGCPITEKNEQPRQQFPQEQPIVIKPYKKDDKIAGQTSRLVIGIISCCLFFVIMLQSCAVGVSNTLANEGESSGTFGFMLSITMLISGILCIVMRKKESKVSYILPICFYTLGSLLSAVGGGSYSDLFVWCSLGMLFASIILFNFFNSMESKNAVLAVVVPIVFFIIMTGAVNGLKPQKETTQETVKEIRETANVEENSKSNADSASNTTVEKGEETETEKQKYNIGDTWQNEYVLVSYDDCGEYESDNQFIQPADGNKYIYATFTFENVGDTDITVAYWDFDCYADGYACEGTYGADEAAFSQTLSAGRKTSGTVYFEVPEEAAEIEFEYSPSFWTSEKIVFVYQ